MRNKNLVSCLFSTYQGQWFRIVWDGETMRVFLSSYQFSIITEIFIYNLFLSYTIISFINSEVIPEYNIYLLPLDNKPELESAFLFYEENKGRGQFWDKISPVAFFPILGFIGSGDSTLTYICYVMIKVHLLALCQWMKTKYSASTTWIRDKYFTNKEHKMIKSKIKRH